MKDKNKTKPYRDYTSTKSEVKHTYKKMQRKQTVSFVQDMKNAYASDDGYVTKKGKHVRMRFKKALKKLNHVIDDSDPDTDLPQIYHAYQTGEALKQYLNPNNKSELRKNIFIQNLFSEKEWRALPQAIQAKFSGYLHELYPHVKDWSWLPLIGFLHDAGKVLATKKWGKLPQWAVVGDTFPVGAPFSKSNVFYENHFFKKNPSLNIKDNKAKKFGKYKRHCGFENLDMSWGHDEYFYSVLKRTVNFLPDEALYIVRFHSFYPWHTPQNGIRGYEELAQEIDWLRLPLLKAFQKSDLYSKKVDLPDVKKLEAEYMQLSQRFVPNQESEIENAKPAKILW